PEKVEVIGKAYKRPGVEVANVKQAVVEPVKRREKQDQQDQCQRRRSQPESQSIRLHHNGKTSTSPKNDSSAATQRTRSRILHRASQETRRQHDASSGLSALPLRPAKRPNLYRPLRWHPVTMIARQTRGLARPEAGSRESRKPRQSGAAGAMLRPLC